MITIRKSEDRFLTKIDWLESRHAFSFGEHYDPRFRGYGDLIVINDDHIAAGMGFGRHGHRDMEIITYVLEGELKHEDSLGTSSVIRPGEVQRMSAGTGVLHSEVNPSPTNACHLLQIWLLPSEEGIPPSYEQKEFPIATERNRLHLIASQDGHEGSLKIHQDASVYAAVLDEGGHVEVPLASSRRAWVQIARGSIDLNGTMLEEGDGAMVSQEHQMMITALNEAEILIFDLR
jgi:redox-sensitive bicupin YhaK (pirin superfamily)